MGSMRMRIRVYVDGMNLYYGALKRGSGAQYKWLNLVKLACEVLPPRCDVVKVLYFTSRISKVSDSDAPDRQKAYIDALKRGTEGKVEIHYGNFLPKTIWRPLVNLPIANQRIEIEPPVELPEGNHRISGDRGLVIPVRRHKKRNDGRRRGRLSHIAPVPNAIFAEVHTIEEKGSDVNLATHLINDAWEELFDAAAVISNDTDLVTPIRMVRDKRNKPIYIICPRPVVAKELEEVATDVFFICSEHLSEAQFSDIVANSISKPESW